MAKKSSKDKDRDLFQTRASDPVLRRQLNERIKAEAKGHPDGERGAQPRVLDALLRRGIDAEEQTLEHFERIEEQLAELRSELSRIRGDFGHCVSTLLVATERIPPEVAQEWVEGYFREAGLSKEV